MRVAHLINRYDWLGGIETYVLNLIPMLQSRGIEQAAVCNGIGNVEPPKKTIINGPGDRKRVKEQLDRFQPNLVHVHNLFDLDLLEHITNSYPVIFTTHGFQLICPAQDFYLEKPREICEAHVGPACITTSLRHRCLSLRPNHALRTYRLARWALRNRSTIAHLISPCSYAGARHVKAGFSPEQVSVIPYFCDLQPLVAPRPLPKKSTVTFLGRITAYKGADLFLQILAGLPNGVRGLLIGNLNDTNRAWLERLGAELGVADRLDLRPWVGRDKIREVFDETSVFIFPSIWPETLGIVGLESLSCGVPVVAFDIGGAREWCLNGETGYRASPKNVAQAVSFITRLLDDEKLSHLMGEKGLRLVAEKFSPAVHIDALLAVYDRVAKA